MPPTRYRQIVSPVGLDEMNQKTGGVQAARELSDAFASFSRLGMEAGGVLRAQQGASEGEAAGAAGAPRTRTGLGAITKYGAAYNSAAEAAYSSKIQTDIAAEFTKLEQDYESNLVGYNAVAKGYAEKLLQDVPPEYRVRVQQAVTARHAAGAARVRDQQIAFEREANRAAVLEGMDARANLAVAGAIHLPREEGDAALEAALEDNRLQLDALVADHVYSATQAVQLQQAFAQSLDEGLFAQRTQPVVDGLMNEAKVSVRKGDQLMAAVMADELIPLDERLTIRKAYDAQRTALHEDRSRAMIAESTALAQRLAADESGPGVERESWRLYDAAGISDAEHTGNLRKSIENGKKKVEDGSDVSAVLDILKSGRRLDPADPKQRKALNTMVDQTVAASNMQPGDDRWTAFMLDTAKNTNILPAQAESYARVNMLSGDPLQAAKGAAFFSRVQETNPVAWDYNSDPKLAVFGEQLNRSVAAGIDPARAYELTYENVYKITKEDREMLEAELGSKKDLLGNNKAHLEASLNDDPHFDPVGLTGAPDAARAMQGDYNRLVSQYFMSNGGDLDEARSLAGKAVKSNYGVSGVNGERAIMKYAPERMYGLPTEVIRDDMMKSVAAVGGTAVDPAGFPIDLTRPRIKNPDGSFSTESTITVGMDGRQYNIPTIVDGKRVDNETAVADARRRLAAGEKLPNFDTVEEAVAQAGARSQRRGELRNAPRGSNVPSVIDPNKIRLVPEGRGLTEHTRGLKWNIVVEDEDGDYDVIRGPDNQPLVYQLPVGQDFAAAKARNTAEQMAEFAITDEAARKRDPLYRDLAEWNVDERMRQ